MREWFNDIMFWGIIFLCLAGLGEIAQPAHADPSGSARVIPCDHTAIYDASTSGSTQMVGLVAGQKIYVCGYQIVAGGTATFKFSQGTGTNCGTGAGTLTPAFSLVAQSVMGDSSPVYRGLGTAAGQALCITASSGVAAQVLVYYTQF